MNKCNSSTIPILKQDGSVHCHPRACRDNDCPCCSSVKYNMYREIMRYIALTYKMDYFACLTANPKDPTGIFKLAQNVERDLFRLHPEGYRIYCQKHGVKYLYKNYKKYCDRMIKYDIAVQFAKYRNALRAKKGYPVKLNKREIDRLEQKFRQNSLEELNHIQSLPYGWLSIRVGELQKNHRIHFHYLCNGWLDGVVYQYTKKWKGISYAKKIVSGSWRDLEQATEYIMKYVSKTLNSQGGTDWKKHGVIHVMKNGTVSTKSVPQVRTPCVCVLDGAIEPIAKWGKARMHLLTFVKEELHMKEVGKNGDKVLSIPLSAKKDAKVNIDNHSILYGIFRANPRRRFHSESDFIKAIPDFAEAVYPAYVSVQEGLCRKYAEDCRKTQEWTESFFASPVGRDLNFKVHAGKITKREFYRQVDQEQKKDGIKTTMELTEKLHKDMNAVSAVAAEYGMNKFRIAPILKIEADLSPFGLTPEQKDFLDTVKLSPITLLDGEAGTGKSYVIAALLSACDKAGIKALLTSVSSMAVKILQDKFSKLLGTQEENVNFKNSCVTLAASVNNYFFSYIAPLDSLDYDLIIVDEVSMMPIQQLTALFACAKPGTRFVFCGDFCQLPPIGSDFSALSFLQNMKLPVCKLTQNLRSKQEVTELAKAIRSSSPDLEEQLRRRTAPINQLNRLIMEGYQIVTNTHREINNIIGRMGKKADLQSDGLNFSIGDICIAAKNIAYAQVMNGEAMTLVGYKKAYHRAVFTLKSSKEIELPINDQLFISKTAITVHKSQGNEFEKVAVVVECRAMGMCSRNWLYTAVTRAKTDVKILFDFTGYKSIGDPIKTLARAEFVKPIHYDDGKMQGVMTNLSEEIQGYCDQERIGFKRFLVKQIEKANPKLYEKFVSDDPDLMSLKTPKNLSVKQTGAPRPDPSNDNEKQLTFWEENPKTGESK